MQTNQNATKTAVNATRAAQAQATPAKPAKAAPAPKVDATLAKKVHLLTEKGSNPKRVGTASHVRFGKYKEGMTVASYLEACGEDNRRSARADIAWDQEHKYIELKD